MDVCRGSGKTTLMEAVMGLHRVFSGDLSFQNESQQQRYRVSPDGADMETFRSNCGWLPQSVSLVPGSIYENIAFALRGDYGMDGIGFRPSSVFEAAVMAGIAESTDDVHIQMDRSEVC